MYKQAQEYTELILSRGRLLGKWGLKTAAVLGSKVKVRDAAKPPAKPSQYKGKQPQEVGGKQHVVTCTR